MQVKELGHVVLFVRDLEKSVHFYHDILGFKPIEGVSNRQGAAMFSSGRTHHELLLIEVGPNAPLPSRGRRAGLYHIGLKIGDSLDELRAAKAELQAAGVPIVGQSDHNVSKSLYLLDPDGNEIEVFIDDPEVDWHQDPAAVAAPTKPLYL
jgi:catechol 2,3-dioxygenase